MQNNSVPTPRFVINNEHVNNLEWIHLDDVSDNPKIDVESLIEFKRLIKPLEGVIFINKGANYNISHPFKLHHNNNVMYQSIYGYYHRI